jgi:hypothetical protein
VFAAASGSGSRRRVYVADLAGGKPRPISPEGTDLRSGAGSISPDGRRIVGVRGGRYVTFSMEGGEEPRVLSGVSLESDRAVQWSADSRSHYLNRFGSRPLAVELVDVETGARRPWKQIALDSQSSFARVRLTPSGNAYVYAARLATSELYLVEGLR